MSERDVDAMLQRNIVNFARPLQLVQGAIIGGGDDIQAEMRSAKTAANST